MATVMTLEEVAEFLRVHPSTVYRLLKGSQYPGFQSRFRLAFQHRIDREVGRKS
jgi:excisionase family DNA binding protein